MNNNKKVYLIDVRSNQEYREFHLQNSINLPVYDLDKKIDKYTKDKNDIIILYCQTDFRSKKAKKILEKMKYNNVFFLKGGLDNIQ